MNGEILILFGILALYITEFIFEAYWDKSAFEKGESKHRPKSIKIGLRFIAGYLVFILPSLIHYTITIICCILLRYVFYDLFLNHIREEYLDYKTDKIIYKIMALIALIGFITLFYEIK